jgi:hypothetical protein
MGKFTISYYFDWAIFNSYVGWRKKTADFFVVNFNRIPGHFFFYPAEKGTCARSKNIHVFRGGATLNFGFDSLLIVLRNI